MNLRQLKWTFLLVLLVFFLFVEFAAYNLSPFLGTWRGRVLMDLVTLVGCLFILGLAFELMSKLQRRVERRSRELYALHRAALDIYGDLSLDTVLNKVVDQAAQLLEARYGAISVTDSEGRIQQFMTTGVAPEQRRLIGHPPRGEGLLGYSLHRGECLRLVDISRDERSVGFPEHHPPMRSLLAVPVICKGPFRGNLYLAEKESAPEFSQEDEETLIRFSTAAAIAIDNAYLHQQLRALAVAEERVRIGREMHDGMAQVLAYVNTKAQVVREFLRQQKPQEAAVQLDQLAAAAREVYVDVREQIAGLRTDLGPDRDLGGALRRFARQWQDGSGIHAELDLAERVELTPVAELQILRIIQEALANVRKHSRASNVRVTVQPVDGVLVAEVADDGAGFDPAAKQRAELPRFGLAIMRERAESIGARFSLESQSGGGTRVRVEMPLSSEARMREEVAKETTS